MPSGQRVKGSLGIKTKKGSKVERIKREKRIKG